jgi:hypothetical protein
MIEPAVVAASQALPSARRLEPPTQRDLVIRSLVRCPQLAAEHRRS